jgi:hypothetical protein
MGSRQIAGKTVTTHNLSQQLLRDLQRSPKKAALLALLAGVALWFWAPLFVGCFRSEEFDGVVVNQVAAAPVAVAATALSVEQPNANGVVAKLPETHTQDWRQLVKWMGQDSRLRAAERPLAGDPFAPRRAPAPKPATSRAKTLAQAPTNSEQLGLKLTATLLGPEKRFAMINGRAYAEGQAIKAAPDRTYVVRYVEERKVTLEGDGKAIVLKAVKPSDKDPSGILRALP